MNFKFKPYQHVKIKMLDNHAGRVSRCVFDGGEQLIYHVHYMMNGEGHSLDFYEDELEAA